MENHKVMSYVNAILKGVKTIKRLNVEERCVENILVESRVQKNASKYYQDTQMVELEEFALIH